MREIPYLTNREACMRILGKAVRRNLLVSDGDVTTPITVNSTQPIVGIGKGDTVNLFARKNSAFDKVALSKIARFCTKHLPKSATLQERFAEMTTEQLAATIAITQLGSYNCHRNAAEVTMYVGRKCKLTIGAATKTAKFGDEQSFFAKCTEILQLPSSELEIVTIDGFIPMGDAVSTVNFGGNSSNQFADWGLEDDEDDTDADDDDNNDVVTFSQDYNKLTVAQLKEALTNAAITIPAGVTTKPDLVKLAQEQIG